MNEAEQHHVRVHRPSQTAREIAFSAVRVAHSDIRNAAHQIRQGTIEEAIQILGEAREQLEFAQNALTGRTWILD